MKKTIITSVLAFSLVSAAAAQQSGPEPVFRFSGVQTLNGEIKSFTLWENGTLSPMTVFRGAHARFNTGAKIYGMGPKGELIDTGAAFVRPMACAEIENLAAIYQTDPSMTKGKPKGTAQATDNEFYKGWRAAGCAEENRKFPGRETPRPLIN